MIHPVDLFVDHLMHLDSLPFERLEHKIFAGASFFYIQAEGQSDQKHVESFIEKEAARFTDGTAWQASLSFVRHSERRGLIYRFQLSVPNEKSFCCGNQCPHCILYRNL